MSTKKEQTKAYLQCIFSIFFSVTVVSHIFDDSFVMDEWVFKGLLFNFFSLLNMQNVGWVVKIREVYTPSLKFA